MNQYKKILFDDTIQRFIVETNNAVTNINEHIVNISNPAHTWILHHNQNTDNIIVQVYMECVLVEPDSIEITDLNTVTITFSEDVTGIALLLSF